MSKLNDNKSDYTWLMPMRCVIFVLMWFMAVPVWAGTVMINQINGNSCDSISLNGKMGKVAPGVPLKKGDVIKVHKRGCSVKLIDESKPVIITYDKNNHYTVKGGEASPKGGFITTVSDWFVSLWQSKQYGTTAVVRGVGVPSLMMPMLEGQNAKIVAKERSLHLAWIGGKVPYTVQLCQIKNGRWFEIGKEVTYAFSTTLKNRLFVSTIVIKL